MGFTKDIRAFTKLVEDRAKQAVKDSALELEAKIKAGAPKDDASLISSIEGSTTAMPAMQQGTGDQVKPAEVTLEQALETFEMGDTIYIGVTAPHAHRKEFGFTGADSKGRVYAEPPQAFVRKAAQQWPAITRRNARKQGKGEK